VGITAGGSARELDRTAVATHAYSLVRTRSLAVTAAAGLVPRRLRLARERGWAIPDATREVALDVETRARPGPGGSDAVALLSRLGAGIAGRVVAAALADEFHWAVGIAPRPATLVPHQALRAARFEVIEPPRDRFYADPFLLERDGRHFLFVESFSYTRGRGVIAAAALGETGAPARFETVLERPYHLSYPFVMEWGGEVFMIPETCSNGTVELYRCERFPDRWVFERALLEGVLATDATVLEWEGRLWMFVCMARGELSPDTELHLFHAADLRGPWTPHPLNPVVSDVRFARPAGRPWRDGSGLIRPAQDCSARYGSGVSFRRVTLLAPEDYAEEALGHVDARDLAWRPGAVGTHTWNADSRFCAADACVVRWRLSRWFGRGGARSDGARSDGAGREGAGRRD
jgi:hypothetical protein